jgi:uncharacterized iron-regulated membrane protein
VIFEGAVMCDLNSEARTPPNGLYHFIWRWHFYAGLVVAPFLIILALTGAIYLFKNELEGVLYRDIVHVAPVASPTPVSAQEAAVLNAYPGATITSYVAPLANDRAAEWAITTSDGARLAVFTNPAEATLTGAIDADTRVMALVSEIHGELLLGRTGDWLVEFAGCWAFVLLVTGIFLWWPRKGRKAGVIAPRINAKGRGFWRDLHAVPAAWNAPIIAFLILTGLPWSGFWGENLAKLGTISLLSSTMAPSPNFRAPPNAPPHAQHEHTTLEHNPDASNLPWSVRHVALPTVAHSSTRVGIDQLIALADARGVNAPGLRILFPRAPDGVVTLSYVPQTAQGQRTVHIDPRNGAIVQDIAWAQYSALGKVVEFGVETHMGKQFGLVNQLLMLTSCALLIFTVCFGIVMWWTRRPAGRIGAPPAPDNFRPGWPIIAIAIVLGVLFPLVGASMLLIVAIEFVSARLWRRRSGA